VSKIKTYLSLNTFVVPSEENMIGSIRQMGWVCSGKQVASG